MAKGRKRVSLSNDAFSALNSVGKEHRASGSGSSKEDKETRKFNRIASLFQDLQYGSHKGSDGKRRQIRSDNKAAIVNRVVRLLAEGVSLEQMLHDSAVLACVRAERFGLSPVGENPDMAQITQIRDIVLSDLPEGVKASDVCAVFNWDVPEGADQETEQTAENASTQESAPEGNTEAAPEKNDAEKAGRVRRRNRKAEKNTATAAE